MEVIPVLDIKGGRVVRGVGGRRAEYAPWASPLGGAADPAATLDALLAVAPFRAAYIADLDAIMGEPPVDALLARLAAARPDLALWVDNGAGTLDRAVAWLANNSGHLVLGSESQGDAAAVAALRGHPRVVLSLDFRGDAFLGPAELLRDSTLWPSRVVVMTLARVGEQLGPDFGRVADVVTRARGARVHAAGGVRHAADLARLAALGAAGALVASALHTGGLTRGDLAAFAERRPEVPTPPARSGRR